MRWLKTIEFFNPDNLGDSFIMLVQNGFQDGGSTSVITIGKDEDGFKVIDVETSEGEF